MQALLAKLSCVVWGHHVDNHVFKQSGSSHRRCRCGADYLGENLSVTRVRHTLSCFLGKHTYEKLADRDGCHEYVCTQCGHPLLFEVSHDPYAASTSFKKKVRYLCGLFGHQVKHVATRHGLEEYACFCGHSFLSASARRSPSSLRDSGEAGATADRTTTIRHPLICVFFGHFIHFLTRRGGYAEYVCRNCGHPFCFAYNRANEAGYFGHVHGTDVHQPVPAVVGAAHRI